MLSHTEDHDEGQTCGPLPHATPPPVISTSCPINDAIKKAKNKGISTSKYSHVSVWAAVQGCHPEGKSSWVVGEEGWRLVVVPVGLEELGAEDWKTAPSPGSAEGWACFLESTGPESGGKCLEKQRQIFCWKEMKYWRKSRKRYGFIRSTFEQLNWDVLDKLLPPAAWRLLGGPLLDVKLTEAAGQIHDGHRDNLWFPLQGQHGAQAARDTEWLQSSFS